MNATQQDVHDVFGELYKSLTDAYWVASTIVDKDRIRGMADAVFEIVTALNQADLKARTEDYARLKETVTAVNSKLSALQGDIDNIIHNVGIATGLVQGIGKALDFGGKFFV